MGILKLLKEHGFIEETENKPVEKKTEVASTSASTFMTTTFTNESSVSSTPQTFGKSPKEAFLKFFEDAMKEANLPGDDYYEFRTQLSKMRERMGNRTNRILH